MKKEHKFNIDATKFFVEENEKGLSKTKVAELYGANRKAITKLENNYQDYIISARESDKDFLFLFEPKELEACFEFQNNPNITKVEIRQKYGIGSSHTFDNWLEILGIPTERHYKYNFNRKIFSQDPTEELAYWVGFLLADGYVNNYYLNVRLAEKDKNHVYKLAQFLGYSDEEANQTITTVMGGAYNKNNVCYDICVNSVDMVKDLAAYNITNKKSMKEIPYHFSTPELQLAYIRGIIDGDGWITDSNSLNDKRMGVVGSKEVCEYIKEILSQYTDAYIMEAKPKAESKDGENILYYWQTTNLKATKDILKVLYPENCSIYLERKFRHAVAVYKSQD